MQDNYCLACVEWHKMFDIEPETGIKWNVPSVISPGNTRILDMRRTTGAANLC